MVEQTFDEALAAHIAANQWHPDYSKHELPSCYLRMGGGSRIIITRCDEFEGGVRVAAIGGTVRMPPALTRKKWRGKTIPQIVEALKQQEKV